MKKMRKLLSLLALAGAIIALPVGNVDAMAASSNMAVTANENASNSNQLSVKQLTDEMESGEVQTILWREDAESGHLDSEAYSIWANDTYSESEYKVSEDVFQTIKTNAIENDVKLIVPPFDGDGISEKDFAEIYTYIKINNAKAEKNGFTGYRCVLDTNLGELYINFSTLNELYDFATTYKLTVGEATNSPKNIAYCISLVMLFTSLAVFIGLMIKNRDWVSGETEAISVIEAISIIVPFCGVLAWLEVLFVCTLL